MIDDEITLEAPDAVAEDEAPDWRKLAGLTSTSSEATFVIPKRGEKDFAPSTSKEATERELLNESLGALFGALQAGDKRQHPVKVHTEAVWDNDLERALIHGRTYGVHFTTMGIHRDGRLELLPEEALYLLDRGVLECMSYSGDNSRLGLPMSVQQAYSVMLGRSLKLHHYQVYAHLKRHGFTLVRSRSPITDYKEGSALARSRLLSLSSVLSTPLSLIYRTCCHTLSAIGILGRSVVNVIASIGGCFDFRARRRPLLSSKWWFTYDQLFSSLQIIPTGHHYKNDSVGDTGSNLIPFYDVYKPITKYRKRDPPPPDFRLVVIDAKTDPFPSKAEFDRLFASVPSDTSIPTPASTSTRKNNNNRRSANADARSTWSFYEILLYPFKSNRNNKRKTRTVAYQQLKAGTKPVVLGIVDCGTISFFSVSQGDFAEWPFMGRSR